MGRRVETRIDTVRAWIDPDNEEKIPELDYRVIHPVTEYGAVHQTEDEESATLEDDLLNIREVLASKQDKLVDGSPGSLMTWTAEDGKVGSTEIVHAVNPDDTERSNQKIPSERAVGLALDLKTDKAVFNNHIEDKNIHVTEEEKERWNSMSTAEEVSEHINNEDIHVTPEEKESWDNKANNSDFSSHVNDTTNPHNVTAHQTGTYSSSEIDRFFASIKESFFTYKGIKYVSSDDTATIEKNSEDTVDPAYILEYGEDLPTPTDDTLSYFAVKPVTDYSTNQSNNVMVYLKEPGLTWRELGVSQLSTGDMMIRSLDDSMNVWSNGHFLSIQTGTPGSDQSNVMWRPVVNSEGVLSFVRSSSTTPPDPVNIKGEPGYTPQKGIDYFDGADGIGIPEGGSEHQIIVKVDGFDYNTEWMSLADLINSLDPAEIPSIISDWNTLKNKPTIYDSFGDDENGLINQKTISEKITEIDTNIESLQEAIGDGVQEELNSHLRDYNNPHRVTPSQIGAVSYDTYASHVNNKDNPHQVTPDQIGLGEVNNTSDLNKPISLLTQAAIDALENKINQISEAIHGDKMIVSISWVRETCTLTFGFSDGTDLEVVFPIASIFESMAWDNDNNELVFTLPDGTEQRVRIDNMVTAYTGYSTNTIETEVDGEYIKASVKTNSIDGTKLVENINLRGTPTTTTQPVADNTENIATTKFVKSQVVDNLTSDDTNRPLSANMGKILDGEKTTIQDVLYIIENTPLLNIVDNLTSNDTYSALSANMGRQLNLIKADKVHTASSGSTYGRSSAQVFGHARAGSSNPLMDGEAEVGTDDGYYSRADHRHPTDETRAPIYWNGVDKMTGSPKAETPPTDSNNDRIATTEWVVSKLESIEQRLTDIESRLS